MAVDIFTYDIIFESLGLIIMSTIIPLCFL